MKTITKKYLLDNRTKSRGWTKKQLEALGLSWPPVKGWHDLVIGKEISNEAHELFISDRGIDSNQTDAFKKNKLYELMFTKY